MLALAVRNTKKLVRAQVKEQNIRIGNRFTKKGNAALMASLADTVERESVSILCPGAGTGILPAALVEEICKRGSAVKFIDLVCYENEPMFIPMLTDNLERIRKKCKHDYNIRLRIKVVEEDFILKSRCVYPDMKRKSDVFGGYDYAILNPPDELCERSSQYANATPDIVSASISSGYIFTALALDELGEGGQLIAYLPTAMAYGAYHQKFRKYIFERSVLARMHVFVDGKRADAAVKKNFIIKTVKGAPVPRNTTVSSSLGDEFSDNANNLPQLPYEFVVRSEYSGITLVRSVDELRNYIFVASMPNTLSSLGLKIRTGLTLESRYPEFISNTAGDGRIPLITPKNLRYGYIDMDVSRKYIQPIIPSLSQQNKNILVMKRVPSRSDGRHLVCAVYLASQNYGYESISTHNKLVYIDYSDEREMDSAELHGLYALLSSTLYEKYCSVISGEGLVSVGDYSNIPLPDIRVIRAIGESLSTARTLSSRACDNLVNRALGLTK